MSFTDIMQCFFKKISIIFLMISHLKICKHENILPDSIHLYGENMEKLFWKNGRIFEDSSKIISPWDLGLTRGYGVFDFLRTYGKTPFELEAHFNRLVCSCREIDLELPYCKEVIFQAIYQLIETHQNENLGIKIYVTAGESADGFIANELPTVWIVAAPITPMNSSVLLKTIFITRQIPQIKSLNYLACSLWAKRVRKIGYDDIIYKNDGGFLLESSTSNLFFIKGDELITADKNILYGITRKVILDLAKDHFTITKRAIHESELSCMDECFITSTSREICPVDLVDQQRFQSSASTSRTIFLQSIFSSVTKTSMSLRS